MKFFRWLYRQFCIDNINTDVRLTPMWAPFEAARMEREKSATADKEQG